MWKKVISYIQEKFRTYRLPVRSPVFLLDNKENFSFRRFQPIVQGKNQQSKGEEGGYCVSITLFILQLFRQNCLETSSGCDANDTPWTEERFRSMLDTYLLISIGTGHIQTDIRGFNVAVMRRLDALAHRSDQLYWHPVYDSDDARQVPKDTMLKLFDSYSHKVIAQLNPQDIQKRRKTQQIIDTYRNKIYKDRRLITMKIYKSLMSQVKDKIYRLQGSQI
jgi:hypothetical protein